MPKTWIERLGPAACVIATLLGVGLHVVNLTHAGGLWRDEAAAVQLASSPHPMQELGQAHEWFPLFYFALLHAWTAVGLGGSDFSLRILGFLVGLGLLAAIWINARLMGSRWPCVALGLLAVNFTVVRWGDSLRAYGCGSIFILLTFGLVWRLAANTDRGPRNTQHAARSTGNVFRGACSVLRAPPEWVSFILASVAAILSVQTLYQNAFLVLAACAAGALVCARRRDWKRATLVLGAGLTAAASFAPYIPLWLRSQQYVDYFKLPFQPEYAWASLLSALGSGLDWPALGWAALAVVALGRGWLLVMARPMRAGCAAHDSEDLPLYAVTALVAGAALFVAFLLLSEFPLQPWYLLPLMVFAAAAMDAAGASGQNTQPPLPTGTAHSARRVPHFCAVLVAVMVCVPVRAVWKSLHSRMTNLDLIAAELQRQARPGDLVLVHPFFLGITFNRYYRGQAEWTTLPPIADHRFHRIDQLRDALPSKRLLEGMLDRVKRALESGHAVWMVGLWAAMESGGAAPPELPEPPAPGQKLSMGARDLCYDVWELQPEYLVVNHARNVAEIPVAPGMAVSGFENMVLVQAKGWR